jgi:methionyl-tRNA formyltransferase
MTAHRFMGTPPLAATVLDALLGGKQFDVALRHTVDQPKGRELKLQPSAVKELASKRDLPVLQPERARDPQFIEAIRQLGLDLIAVAAYGQILPQALLDVPKFGCLNVHTSLLPKYRGAAPIQWAILNGDAETGDHHEDGRRPDTGASSAKNAQRSRIRYGPDVARSPAQWAAHCSCAASRTQTEPLDRARSQRRASYARKIKKEDGRLIGRSPRAFSENCARTHSWPGTYSFTTPPAPMP